MQECSQGILLGPGQRIQKGTNGGKTSLQEGLAQDIALLGKVQRDCAPVASFAPLDEPIGDKPIHETHRSWVGQTQDMPQLIVGWTKAISDHDECRRRFARTIEDVTRRLLDTIHDCEPDDTEQICGPVNHPQSVCAQRTFYNLTRYVRSAHIFSCLTFAVESVMSADPSPSLTLEHRDFYERFKSFWAAPSGSRVAELIAPDATIHFTGAGTFSGAEYIDVMAGMLASMVDMTVTPLDCAGNGDRLYISWETSAVIDGKRRTWVGVDRFRLANGMAIEEQVIFDSAVLQPAN